MFEEMGFETIATPQESKSKAAWFSSIVENKSRDLTEKEVLKIVLDYRKKQFNQLVKKYNEKTDRKEGEGILTVDQDIQMAALSAQLAKYGEKIELPQNDCNYIKKMFDNTLSTNNISKLSLNTVERPLNFRDRANAQDKMEEILKNNLCRFQVVGGRKIGKGYLISQVLSHRAFNRSIIFVDIYKSTNIWNVLEQICGGMCIYLQQEVISHLNEISYNDVKSSVKSFLKEIGDKIILVFQHFDNMLDENYYIFDKELKQFIEDIICSNISCIIFSTRVGCKNDFFENVEVINIKTFPEDRHVINILDDYIDRRGDNNIEYPQELISAIGRHPYLTYFTAKIVEKHGIERLKDKDFINEVKNKLWNELSQRLIDEKTKNIVEFMHMLRIPTPVYEISCIFTMDEIRLAINDGIISKTYKNGEECISMSNFINIDNIEEEDSSFDEELLKKISALYEKAYKRTGNPIWLREYFYFSACLKCNGDIVFGKIYFNDIREAAMYWYQSKKQYELCLWACEKLQEMGDRSNETNILKACCLFRTSIESNIKIGTDIFTNLIKTHPKMDVYKTRYIDSLLYIGKYNRALELLEQYGYDSISHYWHAVEYGKAYMGIHDYARAIAAFNNAIKYKPDKRNYINLAKCYYKKGEFNNELYILKKAFDRYKDYSIMNVYVKSLMRSGEKENLLKAGELLKDAYESRQVLPNILVTYCKYLCRNSEINKARELINTYAFSKEDVQLKNQMLMEVYMCENNMRQCINIIKSMEIVSHKKDALYKRMYLYFARKNNSIDAAIKGLGIKIPKEYQDDIPLHLTHLSLATYANRHDIVNMERKKITKLNKNFEIDKFNFDLDITEDMDYIEQ